MTEEQEGATPGHKSEEDMVNLGQPFTHLAGLDDLSDIDLAEVMNLCDEEADGVGAENCVPCQAYLTLLARNERVQQEVYGRDDPPTAEDPQLPPELEIPRTRDPIADEIMNTLETVDRLRAQVAELLDPMSAAYRVGYEPRDLALLIVVAKTYVTQADALAAGGMSMSEDGAALVANVRDLLQRKGLS